MKRLSRKPRSNLRDAEIVVQKERLGNAPCSPCSARSDRGHVFLTETDSEVVAHLVSEAMRSGLAPLGAVMSSLPRLKGAFALAMIFEGEEDLLIGARYGAPLAVGFGEEEHAGEMFLGSDALGLAPFTQTITSLEDSDVAVLNRSSAKFYDADGKPAHRGPIKTQASALLADKGNYRHFMAKEIHEQPDVVAHTLAHYLDMSAGRIAVPFDLTADVTKLQRLTICACGTAYLAGLTAKYWLFPKPIGAIMADTPDTRPGEVAVVIPVNDVPHAPFIYYEAVPVSGHANGVINLTLSATRTYIGPDGTAKNDLVVVAYLRGNIQAGRELGTTLKLSCPDRQSFAAGKSRIEHALERRSRIGALDALRSAKSCPI